MDEQWPNATFMSSNDTFLDDFHYPLVPEISTFQFVTNGVLLIFIAVLGIIGNTISVIVLSRHQMRSSINCCLIALATFDSIVLITAILMCGLPAIPEDYIKEYSHIFPQLMPWVYPLGLIAQTGSVWITVTVTAERYIAVCHSLKAKSLCTYGRARIYILIITFFSIVYNLPRFLEVRQEHIWNPKTNCTETIVRPTELRSNNIYVRVYLFWLYLFVMYFVPFVSLAALNGLIWRQVQEANRERQRLTRSERKEISLAVMLSCVVIVFFLCNMLALVVSVLEAFDFHDAMSNLTQMSNLLVTVNSSVNFIIYCIFGQKFRRILLRMFCRCRPKHEEQMEESVYPMPSLNTTETKPIFFSTNGTSLYSTR